MFRIHPSSVALGLGLFAAGGLCAAHFQTPAAASTGLDGPQVVETSKLPEAVQATVRKYYGKLEGCKATQESDEGVVVYEITRKKVRVSDPAYGLIDYTHEEFVRASSPPASRDRPEPAPTPCPPPPERPPRCSRGRRPCRRARCLPLPGCPPGGCGAAG